MGSLTRLSLNNFTFCHFSECLHHVQKKLNAISSDSTEGGNICKTSSTFPRICSESCRIQKILRRIMLTMFKNILMELLEFRNKICENVTRKTIQKNMYLWQMPMWVASRQLPAQLPPPRTSSGRIGDGAGTRNLCRGTQGGRGSRIWNHHPKMRCRSRWDFRNKLNLLNNG